MPTLCVSTPRFSRPGRRARTPSTMLSGHLVGTTRVSFNPASLKIAANSFLVRSRPPIMSILISRSLPQPVVARRDDIVDDQNLSILVHGGAAVREDLYRALIVPIVEDILHDVGIAALRHRLEEVSGFEHAASRDAFRGHVLVFPGAGNDRKAGQREPPSASDSP